jgi:hypothetical protein
MASTERNAISGVVQELDRISWQRVETPLLGLIGEKGAKMALMLGTEDYVAWTKRRRPDEDDDKVQRLAEDKWYEANDTIHNVLAVVLRNCPAARTIIAKYAAGGPGAEKDSLFSNGRDCWEELRETALGGQGIETAEGYIAEMYRLADETTSVGELLIEHPAIVQRIKGIEDMTIEKLFKMHFLRCLKRFPEYDAVEHSCATNADKDYEDSIRECTARFNRLKACGDGGDSTMAREGHGLSSMAREGHGLSSIECWNCGQRGHKKANCRVQVKTRHGGSLKKRLEDAEARLALYEPKEDSDPFAFTALEEGDGIHGNEWGF